MHRPGRHIRQGGTAVADIRGVYLPLLLIMAVALAGGFYLVGVV